MQIIWNINDYQATDQTIISLGTFDGVHIGHQAILSQLQEKAKQKNITATMITFEPHPQLVIRKEDREEVQILTSIEEKIEIFNKLGLDRLVVAHFTRTLAQMLPEQFVDEILLKKLAMQEIVVGYDHAFGQGRSGDRSLLEKLGREKGFRVSTVTPVKRDAMIVSSTNIRKLLLQGQIKNATTLLGRYYTVSGQVVQGDGRGRKLGYPTLNVRPHSQYKLVPANGIYATICRIEGVSYRSVTYIGERPTFAGMAKQIETHLFDFHETIYGKEVEIDFVEFIRPDRKFVDEKSLSEQIKDDLRISLELLQKVIR